MKFLQLVTTVTAGALFASGVSCHAESTSMQPPQTQQFKVQVADREITAHVLSPPDGKFSKNPLLLISLAMDWKTSLTVEPYNGTAQKFLANGHRVLSFDLPNHGARVNQFGEGITGMRNAFVAGQDPFAAFVQDAKAVIDRCIAEGIATPGKIVVCGTSRAGYLAIRLLAEDKRIAAAAAYAPVTDWRELSEFASDKNREDVAALRLSQYSDALANKPLFFVIGNQDTRVSTTACCRFYLSIVDANARKGVDASRIAFQVQSTPGHSSHASWHHDGAEFLLKSGLS